MGDREYFRFADDGERRPILRRSSEQTEQMVNLEELRDVCTEEELRALDACADAPDVNQ